MNMSLSSPPSTKDVTAMIQGELSSPRRWFYRIVLLAASVGVAIILSLWTTEPKQLPLRLHVAFAGLTVIGMSWIGVMTWILWQRHCPAARDRIATGWVATGACTLFLFTAVPIAVMRQRVGGVMWIALLGVFLLSIAFSMLWKAYSLRAYLRRKMTELEHAAK
jgi:hypothetical protein